MKRQTILYLFLAAAISSCSTAYQTGQTPDDLYAAKGKTMVEKHTEYVHNDYFNIDDRRIRMAAYDSRWRTLDDYSDYNYSYNPYSYGYNYGYYYNPYYYPYPVYSPGIKYINPKSTVIRTTNLNTYSNTGSVYIPSKAAGNTRTTIVHGYNTSNSNSTRSIDYSTRTYTPATTTNTPSTNNSSTNSSSNSSSSSGTSISRPVRN